MHDLLLATIVNVCRGRIKDGDHPRVQAFSAEILEDALVQLADKFAYAVTLLEEPAAKALEGLKE